MEAVLSLRVDHTRFLPLLELGRPAAVTRLFTTLADGQRKAVLQFFYREGARDDWHPAGSVEWEALPPGPAGEPTLELHLTPAQAGILQLRLRERSTGATRDYQLRLPSRLFRQTGATRRGVRRRRVVTVLVVAVCLAAVGAAAVYRFAAIPTALSGAANRSAKRETGPATAGQKPVVPVERQAPASTTQSPKAPAETAPVAAVQERAAVPVGQPEPVPSAASEREPAPRPAEPGAADSAAGAARAVPAEPLSYRVRWGDTLWRISERYYGDPHLYGRLARENGIADPNLLIPGTRLRLPSRIDGRDRNP